MENVKVGTLVQIDPIKRPDFPGGCILCVSDVYDWGVMGYLFLHYEVANLTRYQGLAYFRVKYEEIVPVGFIEWFLSSREDPLSTSESTSHSPEP